jgi:hypothetical protein
MAGRGPARLRRGPLWTAPVVLAPAARMQLVRLSKCGLARHGFPPHSLTDHLPVATAIVEEEVVANLALERQVLTKWRQPMDIAPSGLTANRSYPNEYLALTTITYQQTPGGGIMGRTDRKRCAFD